MKHIIPVFDLHCHVMESYTLFGASFFQEPDTENARQLLAYLESGAVERLAIPAITLYASADLPCNPLALYAKLLAPGKIYALAGLRRSLRREENAGMAAQGRRLLAAGFDGIKLICKPNLRRDFRFAINDPIFDEFYAEAEERAWPILFHVGDPASFWQKERVPPWAVKNGWYYGEDPHVPSYRTLHDELFDVLRRYPALHITFAHFLFMAYNLDDIPLLFDTYPHVCFDVTPGSEMYSAFSRDPEKTRTLFTKYKDRFLFGTDNTGCRGESRKDNLRKSLERIALMRRFFETGDTFDGFEYSLRGIDLDPKTLQSLFNQNFIRVLGEHPAPVDPGAAALLCRQYGAMVNRNDPFAENTVKLLRQLENIFDTF